MKTQSFQAVKITVDSPQTNRHGLWQFYPAVTSAGSPNPGKPRPGWVTIIENDGYLRICSQENAEKTLADLRTYSHTEQPR
jgi:hypothetical protein